MKQSPHLPVMQAAESEAPSALGRRRFLAGVGAAVVVAGCGDNGTTLTPGTSVAPATVGPPTTRTDSPSPVAQIETEPVDISIPPFEFGVASGDPTPSSVVLWTRLSGDGLGTRVPMVWEIAATDTFDELWATGTVAVTADDGHTVRVIADDLPAATPFWYRFRVGEFTSPTGRSKTLPATGEVVDRVRMAVSSCQRIGPGRFAAHRDIAAADVDFVVWLGDFIYEEGDSGTIEDRLPPDGGAVSLDDYRDRYATYRSDPLLRRSQAAHPWVMIWDDHEVMNDYDGEVDPDRRAAAYRAWWENVPTRLPEPDDTGLKVYRSIDVGDLARLSLVDVRQYASDSTLLGDEQLEWLVDELDNEAVWSILGSPVLFGGLLSPIGDSEATVLPFAWDNHPIERDAVANRLAATDSVILSGDLHTSMVLDVKGNPDDGEEVTVATEFMAPAISSAFLESIAELAPFLEDLNPQVRMIDIANGWLLLDITRESITTEFRYVDVVEDEQSTMTVGPRFRVAVGDPVAEELE